MPSWRIEPLDTSLHDRKTFACGEPDLDRYLAETARRAGDRNTGSTFVAVDFNAPAGTTGKQQILGYSTTSMFAILREALPVELQRGLPDPIPVALLARLAVDQQFQKQGLGRYLLIDALRRIVAASAQVAAYAIIVDAMSQSAKAFYVKYGFAELTDEPMRLFMPTETARQLKQ